MFECWRDSYVRKGSHGRDAYVFIFKAAVSLLLCFLVSLSSLSSDEEEYIERMRAFTTTRKGIWEDEMKPTPTV